MDLANYLSQSKAQRQQLIKAADKYVNKSTNLKENEANQPVSYAGPTAKRFQAFKSQVQEQLQKIFKPSTATKRRWRSEIYSRPQTDGLSKVYAANMEKNAAIWKFGRKIRKGKHMKSREDVSEGRVENCSESVQSVVGKGYINNSLLVPILSTVGTHEKRNKLYKLK